MRRYPAYRDSGVEWLGEVPEGWDVGRFRNQFSESPEKIESDVVGPMLSVSGYRGIEVKEYDDENRRRLEEELVGYRIVRPGQLVVNTMWLNYAGLGVSDFEGHVSPAYRSYDFRQEVDRRFFHHLLRSSIYVQGYTRLLTGIRPNSLQMNREDLMDFPVLFPPLPEQTAIAAFLDRETAKIDALVAEQRRLIDLLREKRQAVISLAVTKGLNHNAPLKPSGIDWLGDVPEGWEVGPLKRFVKFLDGKRIPLSSEERGTRSGDYPYYGASGVIDWIDDYIFDEDLVLVSEDGANLLARASPIAFVARGKYWVNNHAHILKPIDGEVVYWAERIEEIDLTPYVTGSAQPKLTVDALANLVVSAPMRTAQRSEIALEIAFARERFDPVIGAAETAIALLQERRAALISAAVTGKIDVRPLVRKEDEAA